MVEISLHRRKPRRGGNTALYLLAFLVLATIGAGIWVAQSEQTGVLTKGPSVSVGQVVAGQASVIDADTIDIHGERIRFEGVDAPESGQRCLDASGNLYRCGADASNTLARWINGATVSCQIDGTDRYKRLLGTCEVRGQNVQEWLVVNGYALAYRQYSTAYVAAEQRAEADRAGIWSGEFIPPWDWRRGKRLKGEKPTKAMLDGVFASRNE